MIDWEKMASGLLYDANFDPAVLEARDRAQDLCCLLYTSRCV